MKQSERKYSKIRSNVFAFISFFSILNISGQESQGYRKFDREFIFKDGIYLNINNVKANNPIPKSSLLITDDFNDPDFFIKILGSNAIIFFDEEGNRQLIGKNDIWGFAAGGTLRILYRGYFNSIEMIGTISCFFVEDQKYEIYCAMRSGKVIDQIIVTPDELAAKRINKGKNISSFNELDLYLLDFRTGVIHKCNIGKIMLLIKSDSELYNDFKGLPQNLKKALMFYYISKFNEKNPLYLPVK